VKTCFPGSCRYKRSWRKEDSGRLALLMRYCGQRMNKIRNIEVLTCENCEVVLERKPLMENACKKCNYHWSPL